jgi:hypothetical protein
MSIVPNRQMQIFLSYKTADKAYANDVKEKFERACGRVNGEAGARAGRVAVHLFPSIEGLGGDFSHEIKEALCNSECVILLYTDPSHQWDWQHYETGFFHGKHYTPHCVAPHDDVVLPRQHEPDEGAGYDGRRIFVIHPLRGPRPEPLHNIATIPVDFEGDSTVLRKFIERLLFRPSFGRKVALLRTAGSERTRIISRLAEPFVAAMKRAVTRNRLFVPRLVLESCRERPESGRAAQFTVFRRLNDGERGAAFNLLGMQEPEPNETALYEDFLAQLQEEPDDDDKLARWKISMRCWVDALERTINALYRREEVCSGLPLVRPKPGSRVSPIPYRVVIESWREAVDGYGRCKLMFVDLPPELDPLPHGDLGNITLLLRFNRMFRIGIVDAFSIRWRELKEEEAEVFATEQCDHKSRAEEALAKKWQQFFLDWRGVIAKVIAEAYSAGYVRTNVVDSLGPTERRDKFVTLTKKWDRYHKKLTRFGERTRGVPSKAQIENLGKILDGMAGLSDKVYRLAGRRLAELTALPQRNATGTACRRSGVYESLCKCGRRIPQAFAAGPSPDIFDRCPVCGTGTRWRLRRPLI